MRGRVALLLGLLGPAAVGAQSSDAQLATLARLLAAEDRRSYDPTLFERALASTDPLVRRQAALGAGRIQDRRAGAPLLALLESADTSAHGSAMFALGLLGDSTLAGAIIARLGDPRPLGPGALVEAPSTLAKLGSAEARTLFSRLLDGTSRQVSGERRDLMLPGLLLEGWRFGRHAPVRASLPYLADSSATIRWRAAYPLGRTRASGGTRALMSRARDNHSVVRQLVMRGATRPAADSAGVPRDSVIAILLAGLADSDPGVRVNALASLGTWADTTLGVRVAALLLDPVPNVRLQAVTALGSLGGRGGLARLGALADAEGEPLVIRREAMLGLLRADTAAAAGRLSSWAASPDPQVRAASLEFVGSIRSLDVSPFLGLIRDADPGVVAAALVRLRGRSPEADAILIPLASSLLEAPDSRLRSAAWSVFGGLDNTPERVDRLVQGWQRDVSRGTDGATAPILSALRRIAQSGPAGQRAVESAFIAGTPPPASYLLRRAAANWPALAARWGPVYPAEVRYSDAEYRDIASRYLLGSSSARPVVRLELETGAIIGLELLGDHAPLTVANFIGLVDGGFFDGGEWHRVVPNFVVQDGAGRSANPGAAPAPIRDEFNPVRYDGPVLGMALSGPDTGTSQWFINLSPQPHLDGGYTVFGRVISGAESLTRILQGDRIRAIRR